MDASQGNEDQLEGQSKENVASPQTVDLSSNSSKTELPSNFNPKPFTLKPLTRPMTYSSATELSDSVAPVESPFSPWSASSDKQLGHPSNCSDISGDRVFPIRSVINLDATTDPSRFNPPQPPGPHRAGPGSDKTRSDTLPAVGNPRASRSDYFAAAMRRKNVLSGPMSSIQLDAARQGPSSTPLQLDISLSDHEPGDSPSHGEQTPGPEVPEISSQFSTGQSVDDQHFTARFTHVVTEDGHAVITGRDNVLQRCEDEPIHTPGAVQIFGVLLALREEPEGCFAVRYVSENSERLLGYSPRQLFKLSNFLDILTEEQQDNLLDHIDFIRDEDADPAINGPEVFSLSVKHPKKKSTKLWCAIHVNPAHPDLIISEFELDDDPEYPLRPPNDLTPDVPHDTLQSNPTMEEIEDSTEILSKPLRVLRSARKRRGEQGAMQVFDIMSQVQEQLASAPNLERFLKILVGIIKELTGFHRVMIYQFDPTFNGKVVTELVDTSMTSDLYKGLHFPASDIPRQARDLYKLNKVRLLYDRDQDTARIVCRTDEDLEVPLDMSHAYLRAMSPIHLKYLANMAVRSSMSISINAFSELWGLISCHSYGNHGMRVSFPIRKMCRLVGDTASRNIERLSYASRLQARKLINTAPTEKNPSGYIIASSEDLLKLFDADFGLLSIQGETKILGLIEESQEALVMLEYLRMRRLTSVVASQDIKKDFPDLRYPPGFQVIAGILYVPLSVGGSDFIVFFRGGQIKEVKWAGNPYEKVVREGTAGYLEPRTSFKTWHETVVGSCREWNEEQIETAAVLCLVYGKFIEVWRQKEAVLQNSNLTRLLLANSAHEVRTPLNAIINYLEIALEGTLDEETRENLARSHSASKSLIYVINDLLDLTKTEEGQNLVTDDVFDLSTCVRDATEPFLVDARRKGIEYHIVEHPGLPQLVHGDERRIRQAISNVTANAVTHTSAGHVKVEVFVADVRDRQVIIEFVVEDTGAGMSGRQLDTLFCDLEQVSTEESPLPPPMAEKQAEMRTLGLGLAIVARIVRNMNGQLRLKSEIGQGSRFVIQIPFLVPEEQPATGSEHGATPSQATQNSNPVVSAPESLKVAPEGEIMLINRTSITNLIVPAEAHAEQASFGSNKSGGSFASRRSDAERLIEAIQTPLSLDDKEPEYPVLEPSPHPKGLSGSTTSVRLSDRERSCSPRRLPTQGLDRTVHPQFESGQGPGFADVCDSKTPIRAVKIPDEYTDVPRQNKTTQNPQSVGGFFQEPSSFQQKARTNSIASATTQVTDQLRLQVLVAEDDPINMRILRKRLERIGHGVHHTANGEDCAAVYRERSATFDVVLMDMQMPMVDGLTSTKMIRAMEKSAEHAGHSSLASSNHRIPIFAVSASLVEKEKQTYIDAGFDGWILKPIDFKRLNTLLAGISDEDVRLTCLYEPGEWERGGWFGNKCDAGFASNEVTPKAEETSNKQLKLTKDTDTV